MTNTNETQVGKWIGWNGGECPVHPKTVVEVIGYGCYGQSFRHEDMVSVTLDWSRDEDGSIAAYRIIKEYKEPREFWLARYQAFREKENAERELKRYGGDVNDIIHVREVIEEQ
jgi:hypothetical protein